MKVSASCFWRIGESLAPARSVTSHRQPSTARASRERTLPAGSPRAWRGYRSGVTPDSTGAGETGAGGRVDMALLLQARAEMTRLAGRGYLLLWQVGQGDA